MLLVAWLRAALDSQQPVLAWQATLYQPSDLSCQAARLQSHSLQAARSLSRQAQLAKLSTALQHVKLHLVNASHASRPMPLISRDECPCIYCIPMLCYCMCPAYSQTQNVLQLAVCSPHIFWCAGQSAGGGRCSQTQRSCQEC